MVLKSFRGWDTEMHQLKCGEIWGGISNCDDDIVSAGLTASLYSFASDGSKGGDIYYLSLCDSNALTRMILADVIGHGQKVSQISQIIYQAIKSHMNDGEGDKLLAELNQTVLKMGLEAMTTLVMAAFYKVNGNLYFANAGHPKALIKSKTESSWLELKPAKGVNDPVLGVMPQAIYTQNAMRVYSGDCLFLYSDGLVEAHHEQNGFFTKSRLKDLLNQHPNTSTAELKHIVIDEIRRFTGGSLEHDDVTIMIVKIEKL
jgi:sigma-B regulation protein RsbU (phosphoserine phosphatase)